MWFPPSPHEPWQGLSYFGPHLGVSFELVDLHHRNRAFRRVEFHRSQQLLETLLGPAGEREKEMDRGVVVGSKSDMTRAHALFEGTGFGTDRNNGQTILRLRLYLREQREGKEDDRLYSDRTKSRAVTVDLQLEP